MISAGDRRPPDLEEVLQRLIRLVADLEDVDAAVITPESRLVEDLGMDSLSIVEMQMAAEEAFGVELPDDGAVSTVRAAAEAVLAAIRASARGASEA